MYVCVLRVKVGWVTVTLVGGSAYSLGRRPGDHLPVGYPRRVWPSVDHQWITRPSTLDSPQRTDSGDCSYPENPRRARHTYGPAPSMRTLARRPSQTGHDARWKPGAPGYGRYTGRCPAGAGVAVRASTWLSAGLVADEALDECVIGIPSVLL